MRDVAERRPVGYDPGTQSGKVGSAKPTRKEMAPPHQAAGTPKKGGARMKVTRRELLKGAAALCVAGAAPQLVPVAARAQTTQKKELVVAQGGDIARFDPHFSTSSNDIRWSFNVFDNLTSRHPDGKVYPGLATEWK